jgi:ribosomal protein S18 acetylase RimI-like enzyme
MLGMLLTPAVETDYGEIIELANWAYRGTGPTASLNMEAGVLEGQRLTESLIREDLERNPEGRLLIYREEAGREEAGREEAGREEPSGMLLGTVWLEPKAEGVWYMGLLTVRPDQQNQHLGRTLLAAAEEFARERGARRMRMTVLHVRDTLIAWYQRRGYVATGEQEQFPYGDDRFGRPLRDDLHFLVLEKEMDCV